MILSETQCYGYFKRRCFLIGLLVSLILLISSTRTHAQNSSPDQVIELKAIPGLRYDKLQLVVKPGSTIKIVLQNIDQMTHNMLIVKPGAREKVVVQAEALGDQGLENNFIPQSPDILAAIPLLDPDEQASIIFKVPDEEGAYPYVCTYPAHGQIMYGVMHVTNSPDRLPPVEEDPGVPEIIRKERWTASGKFHPYPMEMPQVTRLFMPDASPAAIAVGMEGNQSYCWDAGVCYLRYAWQGGYIDASEQWDAKAQELAQIKGEIYHKNKAGFPFRIARKDSIPKPKFRGYKLVDDYPQFIYEMGNIKVRELILPAKTGTGLKIEYRLENLRQPVWYVQNQEDAIRVEASKGEWEEHNMLKLTPEQAKDFTISIYPE